jgi:hypothetical protein
MNGLYYKGREAFLNGDISWRDDDIRVVLLDNAFYTVNLTLDEFLSDIPLAARIATSSSLTAKTSVNGVADAADAFFTNTVGPTIEACAVYAHTGTDSTSRLIVYFDNANGLPLTLFETDVSLIWDNGPNKIFKL